MTGFDLAQGSCQMALTNLNLKQNPKLVHLQLLL